jgi:hypothetical protein
MYLPGETSCQAGIGIPSEEVMRERLRLVLFIIASANGDTVLLMRNGGAALG